MKSTFKSNALTRQTLFSDADNVVTISHEYRYTFVDQSCLLLVYVRHLTLLVKSGKPYKKT